MPDYMSMVYIGEKTYLVDREAYYLLCKLQEKKMPRTPYETIYLKVLSWLVDNKKAIELSQKPIQLVIPHFNQWSEE
jgi:hypothetical protein